MTHDYFDFLLGVSPVERQRHFAAWSSRADVAVEFIGRLHRAPVELGDDVTGSQAEELCRAVDVQVFHLDAPFFRAGNAAMAGRIQDPEEPLILRFYFRLRRREGA